MDREGRRKFPQRPRRLTWLFDSVRPFYFVTFNTYRRRPILACKEVHEAFVDYCQRARSRDVAVGRYVVMPDHVHLFVAFSRDGMSLSDWVRILRRVLGKRLEELGETRPHWQEGFFDHVLRSADSYAQKWNYVRMNPVRAGLCAKPEGWDFQGEIVPELFDEKG
jgi:putative transposase